MQISKIPFDKILSLSFKDIFYQTKSEKLNDFYAFSPDMVGIESALSARKKYPVDRSLLVSRISEHYQATITSEKQLQNINKLGDENTFTIVTAHQPALLGGPAYYFYKICSVINLATKLNEKYANYHFVPVFVSGAEDHDFDEVKSLHVFGKIVTWESTEHGPVGRFSKDGLEQVISRLAEILGPSEQATGLMEVFSKALASSKNYNEFVFNWINELFGKYGLLVINMDDAELKKAFIPHMEKEILHRTSETLVNHTQKELLVHGFKPQAFARDINLFYMTSQSRERLYYEDGVYKVNNREMHFSENELIAELRQYPERFSPNVVLRPMYQEAILPNIVYVGGGGEVSYWLERKAQFEAFGVFYPVILRRNSVMMVPKYVQKMMEKHHISEADLLLDEDKLILSYLEKATESEFHLSTEIKEIQHVFEHISKKAKAIDLTLENFVNGESHKMVKAVENIEAKLRKSLKHKEETNIQQVKTLRSKLFPAHGLQERTDSFLQYLVSEDKSLLDTLTKILDPLDKTFLFVYL